MSGILVGMGDILLDICVGCRDGIYKVLIHGGCICVHHTTSAFERRELTLSMREMDREEEDTKEHE